MRMWHSIADDWIIQTQTVPYQWQLHTYFIAKVSVEHPIGRRPAMITQSGRFEKYGRETVVTGHAHLPKIHMYH